MGKRRAPLGAGRARIAAALIVSAALVAIALWAVLRRSPEEAVVSPAGRAELTYVGAPACAECHAAAAEAWRGSHHDLAMQEATVATVLGDFDDAVFEHGGVTSTFFRRDDKFFARTDGPDGALHDYEIAYTFGVEPLQQYLIGFPGGRYQALGIAWDSRSREQGGQRWFHLYPDRPPEPGDPLHWTGIDQTWNHMCAECHSTNLRKGYRAREHRYETSWSELDVACEACHGPGSAHVEWARATAASGARPNDAASTLGLVVRLRDRDLEAWEMDPEKGTVRRVAPMPSRLEVETCARCHSRRGVVDPSYVPGRPLLDTHRPVLLEPALYFADGQIRDEVYEYGSFLQSRMYGAGVTCSDCHDPHSLELLASGDALCARCHSPDRFAVESHHHHPADSPGARCVGCHMPQRTYMVVDPRRDHSLRVPRPEVTASIAAPDACTSCHRERDATWAARAIAAWYPDGKRPAHWAETVDAAWRGEAGAESRVVALAEDSTRPPIVRGTAVSLLTDLTAPASAAALARAAADPEGLVRLGALVAVDHAGVEAPLAVVAPLLSDPLLAIRVDAARLLAPVPAERLSASDAAARDVALAEYREASAHDADRPESHHNLGNLALAQGDVATAERELTEALRIDPTFAPARVNLADVLRLGGRDEEAVAVLRAAPAPDAALFHALGLALVRLGRNDEALVELERAAAAAPEVARYAYVLGVAFHSTGRSDEAIEVMARAHRRHGGDVEILIALIQVERESGHREAALRHARELVALRPGDAGARAILAELEGTPPLL